MAHSHYVMDLYYPEDRDPDLFRREVLRIEAKDDEEAEAEGRRADSWRKPHRLVIRAIQTSARSRERVIFDTRSGDEAADGDSAIAVPAPAAVAE